MIALQVPSGSKIKDPLTIVGFSPKEGGSQGKIGKEVDFVLPIEVEDSFNVYLRPDIRTEVGMGPRPAPCILANTLWLFLCNKRLIFHMGWKRRRRINKGQAHFGRHF